MSDVSLCADSKSTTGSVAAEGEDAIGLSRTGLAAHLRC